ncbi:MAG: hypothetical protein KDD73_04605 [Anaerolineales bacterium]|nr:hypothetical protein [Anaerolineales bacterium]MCB9128944.1 NshR/TsnR family 23S rRNA methyltransferase [Ardenticatenales bacterium]MCB9172823.1 NshR/TsnR family 23S rRNA methyltransferase [Ardenticatenales bacterium]
MRPDPTPIRTLHDPRVKAVRYGLGMSLVDGRRHFLVDDEINIEMARDNEVNLLALYEAGSDRISDGLRAKLPEALPIYQMEVSVAKQLFKGDKLSRIFAVADSERQEGLAALPPSGKDLIVLEDLRIMGNVGAIIRSAVAFGAGAVVLLSTEPRLVYDRRLIRASRGHCFQLPVVAATADELLRYCAEHGYELVVTAMDGSHTVDQLAALDRPVALVFGSEKSGASDALLDAQEWRVSIPISPKVESLNVSVAAGILLFARAGSRQ